MNPKIIRCCCATSNGDYAGGRWHRPHRFLTPSELDLRRYPPTGCRALWILYGPDGPPADDRRGVAR